MLMENVNDSDEQLTMLRDAVIAIQPDKVFIMTPIRPPAEKWVKCPDSERIRAAEKILSNAVTVADMEDGNFGVGEFANAAEAILEISARHPLRLEQAHAIEQKFTEQGVIDKLVLDGEIAINRYRQIDYINQVKSKIKPVKSSNFTPELTVNRVNCCTFRVVVKSENHEQRYRVILADAYYHNLTRGQMSKEQLLKYCFQYFLKSDFLGRLDAKFVLRDICQLYHECEKEIKEAIEHGESSFDAN
jgi:hypothetical protein